MAQTEDTELRDLVIETLEKNGSLAKIRALLRANIFLAFEEEFDNIRHNITLDNILKLPEGICALSLVHEFLEFCNLKNTLFVYKSESRQGKDYTYGGKNVVLDKLKISKEANSKEPLLVSLIRNAAKPNHRDNHIDEAINKKRDESGDNAYKDDHNNSYIIHEDSQYSATSTSQSDHSIDEKNKLHLRLPLDNSDTDTSTDSSRDKSASEYIPHDHIVQNPSNTKVFPETAISNAHESFPAKRQHNNVPTYCPKNFENCSSDSTSYVELKPFSSIDEKMLNTPGLPHMNVPSEVKEIEKSNKLDDHSKTDSIKSATLSSVSSLSMKKNSENKNVDINKSQESAKTECEMADYSYDFTASHELKIKHHNSILNKHLNKDYPREELKEYSEGSPHQNSQSSVSISDVADLISDKSSSFDHPASNKSLNDVSKKSTSNKSKKKSECVQKKFNSDDSGEISGSSIPSLSNLSLDIYSD